MAYNYLYNTTNKIKFEIEQQPFSNSLGIQKAFVGKTFQNSVMPVTMYVKDGKLYLSNIGEREDRLCIEEGIRAQFERVSAEKMEATDDNPIIWYITDQFEIIEGSPVYMRCTILEDKILMGIISGEVRIQDHTGQMIKVGRCIPARGKEKEDPDTRVFTVQNLHDVLNRKNPITGKPFSLAGIVDLSLELTKDGLGQTTLSHNHSINYRPVELAKEIERLERREKQKARRENREYDELEKIEEIDMMHEIQEQSEVKPIRDDDDIDDDKWLDEIISEENELEELEEEPDEDDWT